MKELFLKKRTEIDEICKKSHMDMPYQTEMDKTMNLIMSGGSSQLCHNHASAPGIFSSFHCISALTYTAICGMNDQETSSTMIY